MNFCFQLNIWGKFQGTAGDALQYNDKYDHNGQFFTTQDKDNDEESFNF